MTIRLRTQDRMVQASTVGVRERAIRLHLMNRLTEIQYRRVDLLYGLTGEPMTERAAAEVEGVYQRAIQKSHEQVVGKLETDEATGKKVRRGGKLASDGYLWLLWLLGDKFTVVDSYTYEAGGRTLTRRTRQTMEPGEMENLYASEIGGRPDGLTEQEMKEMHDIGFGVHVPRPGDDEWESDAHTRPEEDEARTDGWVAYNEGEDAGDNPYRADDLSEAWIQGYREAEQVDFDADDEADENENEAPLSIEQDLRSYVGTEG